MNEPYKAVSSFIRKAVTVLATCVFAVTAFVCPALAKGGAIDPSDIAFPAGSPYVSDNAGILDNRVADRVDDLNGKWEKGADGAQIAVITVEALPDGYSLESYSMALAEKFKPGGKDADNGLLYLIVSSTREDRLEVGYGLEDVIPDFIADTCLDKAHTRYREGDYPAGVLALLDCVENRVGGGETGGTGGTGLDSSSLTLAVGTIVGVIMLGAFAYMAVGVMIGTVYIDTGGRSWPAFLTHLLLSPGPYRKRGGDDDFGDDAKRGDGFGGGSFGGGGASGHW